MRAVARAVARVARTATRGRRARAMPARADASARHRACERCRGEGATFALSRAQKTRRRLERDDGAATREAPEKRVECAALALALTQRGARATVYERDERFLSLIHISEPTRPY